MNNITVSKVIMSASEEDIQFVIDSLKQAGLYINSHKVNTSLKDVVGQAYELHRKRVYEHFGFTVDKEKNGASFDVDWSIYWNGNLVALEEDKGHYVDSCFYKRCISSFIETIHLFSEANKPLPKLILNSFTKYNLCEQKKNEFSAVFREEYITSFNTVFVYNYMAPCDRLSKENWFHQSMDYQNNPYETHIDRDLIIKDIELIKSLVQ